MRNSISLKIFSIALVIITLMGMVTCASSHYLDKVSDEAIELAHYYIPIEQKVNWAARYSSAELVYFERYLNLRRADGSPAQLKAEYELMRDRSAMVDTVINEALALVKKGQDDREIDIRSKNFDRLEVELPHIVNAHRDMRETIEVFLKNTEGTTLKDHFSQHLILIEEQLARQRTAITKEIADVAELLEAVTRDSAEQALAMEARAVRLTWGVTLAAALIGLILAAFITRSLVGPVRALVASTQQVRQGNLDVHVHIRSSDEIATLADSFNHMIGGLKQKAAMQKTFGKYVDPRIVKNLLENEALAQAGGKRRMTIFFSDIEGFTALSERLPPERLVAFLNRYFTVMAGLVRDEHGIIDKYIGDSIMAFWGPPFVGEAEHAACACRTAVAQIQKLTELRAALPELLGEFHGGLPRLNIRIGLMTGEVTVGSIGSDTQKNYTVVGDPVNLASRLESANKVYGTSILIAEPTWREARDAIETRELDEIRVVGKKESVRIFEVLGFKGAVDNGLMDLRGKFELALAAFRRGNISQARASFEDCLRLRPTDKPSQLFLDRIVLLERSGLPSDWTGVWTLKDK